MNKMHLRSVGQGIVVNRDYQNSAREAEVQNYVQRHGADDAVETRSLAELRLSLERSQQNNWDIVSALEHHHQFIQQSVQVLKSSHATAESRQFHLSRLLHILNMCVKAEEETLYRHLIASDAAEARAAGFRGRYESHLIFQLGYELYSMNFHAAWSEEVAAKSELLLEVLERRRQREEEEVFETAERRLGPDELELVGCDYLKKCLNYLDEEMNAPQISFFGASFSSH